MKNRLKSGFVFLSLFLSLLAQTQQKAYPKGYFRNPLNIPLQLVANFGELRANHWHMGLDIRTQQRENLPVYAAAEGYIAKVKIEPGGFGRAIYINHPNGYTTLYAHLNDFMPALEQYIKAQQYQKEQWAVEINLTPELFPVNKGSFIAYSGNTGGSAGPHVHFEIRDTRTDNCLNPLLFAFPLADAVPPAISRLAMYDRNRSVYHQSPQFLPIKKAGARYTLSHSNLIKVGSNKVSFALGATDRFSNSTNPNGIYIARLLLDGNLNSQFVLDDINYNETRYLNAHIDYRYKTNGGAYLQHLSRMPGDTTDVYNQPAEGMVVLNDNEVHHIRIEVSDPNENRSVLEFSIQYEPGLARAQPADATERMLPQEVNVFERENFELFTTEYTVYDTVNITYGSNGQLTGTAVSPQHIFCSAAIPSHDSVRVRIKPAVNIAPEDKVVIKSIAGSRTVVQKGEWQGDWVAAKFRQFGSFQAFIDNQPPTINAPGTGAIIDLSRAARIVFTPRDNFNVIKSFRAEVDGQWLRFTNDKGRTHIYRLDEKFPRGEHQLKVTVEDVAGNITTRVWTVRR